MKKRWFLAGMTLLLVPCLLVGCGVAQEEYDSLKSTSEATQASLEQTTSHLTATQASLEQTRSDLAVTEASLEQTKVTLGASQAQITELETRVKELREQYEIVGETPAETAENIVERYHETHIYSEVDFFVCGDMATDVWNMLKAQRISAQIVIGNVDAYITDVTAVTHAWVLAEVSPDNYLALESTGGYVVFPDENELYFKGWTFDNPKEYKRYKELRRDYNLRVDIFNQLISDRGELWEEYDEEYDYYEELIDEFNSRYAGLPLSSESEMFKDKVNAQYGIAKEMEGRYNQLGELRDEQDAKIENIASEMRGLTQQR